MVVVTGWKTQACDALLLPIMPVNMLVAIVTICISHMTQKLSAIDSVVQVEAASFNANKKVTMALGCHGEHV
jgi:hypothetical protein